MASSCGRGYSLLLNFDAPLLQFYESAADVCSRLFSVSVSCCLTQFTHLVKLYSILSFVLPHLFCHCFFQCDVSFSSSRFILFSFRINCVIFATNSTVLCRILSDASTLFLQHALRAILMNVSFKATTNSLSVITSGVSTNQRVV